MKLPEKEWLTLEEVAKKWRTDVDRIKHCLITGTLKPCLRQGRELLQIENYHDMQWDWSHMAEASFCDLVKCKIQLTHKDGENVRWSSDREVCEDDLLIALSEAQRFEKACTPDPDSFLTPVYLEEKRRRKQQIDVLPSVSGVRSTSSIANSDFGSAKQDSELDVSAGIPRQTTGLNIVDVPVKSLVVPIALPVDEVEQSVKKEGPILSGLGLMKHKAKAALYMEYVNYHEGKGRHRALIAVDLKEAGATASFIGRLWNHTKGEDKSITSKRGTGLVKYGLELLEKNEGKKLNSTS